jgi:glucose-1-phosphate adenylyltransferase
VVVDTGATVRESVLLPGARVHAGATVERAVLDDGVAVGSGAHVGGPGEVSLVGRRARVADGAHLAAGARAPQH